MATMYDSGYNADGRSQLYGATATLEEERRRRQQAQLAQQRPQQMPPQGEVNPQAREQQAFSSTQPVQTGRFQQGTQQQTFAQLQQAGQARPAPPMPQGAPAGIDQRAVAADPAGYQQWLARAQQQEASRPGSTMLGSQAPTGEAVAFNGQMVNTRYGTAGANPDPLLQPAANTGRIPLAGPPQFTGDVGDYLKQMLNVGAPQVTLPTAQDTSALAKQVEGLNRPLPAAPTYTPNAQLMQQAQQLTQNGSLRPAAAPAQGSAPAAVSAAGVNPTAAVNARAAARRTPEAEAQLEEFRRQSLEQALDFARGLPGRAGSAIQETFLQALADPSYAGSGSMAAGGLEMGGSVSAGWDEFNMPTVTWTPMSGQAQTFRTQLPDELRQTFASPAASGVSSAGVAPTPTAPPVNAPETRQAAPAAQPQRPALADDPINAATNRALLEALQNPSAFDNEAVQQLYSRLGQNIDDQYAQQQTALREEMAARGLSDSSILGGRLADLNVGQRQARTELANQLGIQRAQDFGEARARAIGLGQSARGQMFAEQMGDKQLALNYAQMAQQRALADADRALQAELGRGNLGIQQGNLGLAGQRLGLEAQGQQFGQQMQGLQFQNLLGQQSFDNQMRSADFGLRRAGQEFGQGLQSATFQNMLGQQGFQNNMSLAELQRALGNDAFARQMGITDRITGLGDRAFDNDLRQAEFNRNLQNDAWRRYLDSIVLGG